MPALSRSKWVAVGVAIVVVSVAWCLLIGFGNEGLGVVSRGQLDAVSGGTASGIEAAAESQAASKQDAANGETLKNPTLDKSAVLEAFENSKNYRSFVQAALTTGGPIEVRLAIDAIDRCVEVKTLKGSQNYAEKLKQVEPALHARWSERVVACEASGGPDVSQTRGLSAKAKELGKDQVLSAYQHRYEATEEQLDRSRRSKDIGAALQWGLVASSQRPTLLAGAEPDLQDLPQFLISHAWLAEVCHQYSCDETSLRMMMCIGRQICGAVTYSNQIDALIASTGNVDQDLWRRIRAAMGRRVSQLLW